MRVNNDFFDRERETVSSVQTVLADRVDILSCRRYLYYHFSVLSFSRKKLVFFFPIVVRRLNRGIYNSSYTGASSVY